MVCTLLIKISIITTHPLTNHVSLGFFFGAVDLGK
jgi:hypothetical protein